MKDDIFEYNASVLNQIFPPIRCAKPQSLERLTREEKLKERQEEIKYHSHDYNTNYIGYEGL